jgi:hypothetical protein
MALLVDGTLNTMESLKAQDSGVLEVSHGEGVDLTAKLEIARHEIEIEIDALLRKSGCGSLDQVVATTALKRWHLLLTLSMTYRDAYFSQLNDRYKERWKAYEVEARAAAERVLEDGVGMSRAPLARPGAAWVEVQAGSLAETVYWVRTSWAGADGSESEAGEGITVAADWPHSLEVRPGVEAPPETAVGWNVYVGLTPGEETKQNAAALAIGAAWVLSTGGLTVGVTPKEGQAADFYCSRRRQLRRG